MLWTAAGGRLHEFTPQGMAKLGCALATATHYSEEHGAPSQPTAALSSPAMLDLFSRLAVALEPKVDCLSPQCICDVAWAFATIPGAAAGENAMPLFDALAAATAARVGQFTPAELAKTGWAFARASFAGTRYTMFEG